MTPASSQDPPHAKLMELEETNGASAHVDGVVRPQSLEVMTTREGVFIIWADVMFCVLL